MPSINKQAPHTAVQERDYASEENAKRLTQGVSLPYYPQVGNPQDYAPLATVLVDWFAANKRNLPWRIHYTPYEVWISEVMLQQTQMERGVAYFTRWMQQFPTIESVANASLDTIYKAWEGLGYYARARNLHACAKEVVARFGGQLPADAALLVTLPGIGKYTAGAICSIAFKQPVPLVDANVERVFSRLFDVDAPIKSKEAQQFFWQVATASITTLTAREYNQALMEFGALICTKRPRCELCPLINLCHAARLGLELERPILGKKPEYTNLQIITGLLVHKDKVFIQKRLDKGAWAGLWEFPGGRLEHGETPEQGVAREFLEETDFSVSVVKKLGVVQHAYTRYKISLHCFVLQLDAQALAKHKQNGMPTGALHAATENKWVGAEELNAYAFPAGHRKLLDAWLNDIVALLSATDNMV